MYKNQDDRESVFWSPVEEDEFLFPEHDEGGVSKLNQLWQSEQPGPKGRYLDMTRNWIRVAIESGNWYNCVETNEQGEQPGLEGWYLDMLGLYLNVWGWHGGNNALWVKAH